MFTKWKYKIWKHLTKNLLRNDVSLPGITYAYSFPFTKQEPLPDTTPKAKAAPVQVQNQTVAKFTAPKENSGAFRLITTRGYTYSGSSTLIGMLNEFDNVQVIGYPEPLWAKKQIHGRVSECTFFTYSHFLEMLDSYRQDNKMQQNLIIQKFIKSINDAYTTKRTCGYEYFPELYGDTFHDLTHNLLETLLDLDEETRLFMKDKDFPTILKSPDFDSCCFVQGKGCMRYLFYRFKKLEESELHQLVKDYLKAFFSILQQNKSVLALDQLLLGDKLEKVNAYMDIPIRQVCVYRDPRDRYLSAYKSQLLFGTNIASYVAGYRRDI